MVPVVIIDVQEYTVTVQFEDQDGRVQRIYLHRELVPTILKGRPALVHEEYLKLGIPASDVDLVTNLGDTFSTIQVRDLQDQLRRAGLWTREDYQKNPKVVQGVLMRLIGVDVTSILNAASRPPTLQE